VLALRGPTITRQPVYSQDKKLLLLWNGEVFDSLVSMDPLLNDGEQIMRELEYRLDSKDSKSRMAIQDAFVDTLSNIEGPYATVLYDVSS
jgi:asparagine synthetase B (glutamine-hydrolysing)